MAETLQGQVERVTYHNPDTGFAVLKVRVAGRRRLAAVVGRVTGVSAGERITATGRWKVDRQHGQQFQADNIQTAHPSSPEGIQRYLASGAIRGLGPQLAKRIVELYRERSLEILERRPDMLLHVRGIGPERLRRIRRSWEEQAAVRRIMLFFHECGIGSARAVRVYRLYGDRAIALIKENPYRLADDVRGIGFRTADAVAQRLGVDPNSPHRAEAALRYALHELAQEGHCGCPLDQAVQRTVQLVDVGEQAVRAAAERAVEAGSVVREVVDGAPWLMLASLHRAETGVARALRRLLDHPRHPLPAIQVERAIGWAEQRIGLRLASGQREAIRQACTRKAVVVTGGPGVGKTTVVRSILEIFAAKGAPCVLAAPTGRAAKRLAETTGRPAKTIHRLLEFDPATGEFSRRENRPLAGDLFVVDEASMLDVALAHQLLRAIPPSACLVLVGDADQLPSVGPGAVLSDLIHSGVVPVVRLTEVFRQARQSRIITAAYAVNCGREPELQAPEAGLSDFYFIEADEPQAIQELVVRLVTERIPDRFGFDPVADIQVLAPMNRSQLGAHQLNQLLQEALNPARGQAEVQRFGWTFRVGDRLIQTENNYHRDVFNGDLGIVERINRIDQELVAQFDGRRVKYDFDDLDELSLAYVLSVHKSQGSEYPCVVIPLHTQHYMMLQRNLLYTAITRAKQLAVIVGGKRALRLAVRRRETRRRYTLLKRRLQAPWPRSG